MNKDKITKEMLRDTFGWHEYEVLAFSILKYIDLDFSKTFRREDVTDNEQIFAMFEISGWLSIDWFPSPSFKVSDSFINRLREKNIISI